MSNLTGRVAAATLLIASCVLPACGRRAEVPETPPMFRGELVGQPLPEWEIREWVIDPDPDLRRGRAHPLIVLFWNAHDPASREALAIVQTIAVALNHRGLRVVTIHTEIGLDEVPHRSRVQEFLDANGILLATAIDRETTTLRKFGFFDVPSLVFADAEGIVRGMTKNYRSSKNAEIEAFVRSALLGMPAPTTE